MSISLHHLGLVSPPAGTFLQIHEILGVSWEEDGQWFVAYNFARAGERILSDDGKSFLLGVKKERLGVPPGWQEAAGRLPKDCSCVTHEGPHWLHMDFMDRERNAELVKPPGGTMLAYIQEESTRARELLANMQRLGVTNLREYLGVA